jgi:hypothetical protein
VSKDETFPDFAARHYAQRVASIAGRIREMADRFEREAKPYPEADMVGTPRFSSAAQNALHALTWDTANLTAYDIVGHAARADAAETAGSLSQEETP